MPLLSDHDVRERLGQLDGWEGDTSALRRELRFEDFKESVEFVNRLLPVAEELNHHPDVEISWNRVTLTLSTHSQGGVTESDFELASRVDALG